jgi:hypothetical protein
MVQRAHDLLSEADAVLHYNGQSFDVPVLNTELVLAGLLPPAPFKQIDLYRTVTRRFAFMSNKLDEISKALGTSRKVPNEGLALWSAVLRGDVEARKRMRLYNIGDVLANESLYLALLPWIEQHPNVALIDGGDGCPQCGSSQLTRQGFAYTSAGVFQRYRCVCGKWSRGATRVSTTRLREAV